jgi:hypothetical protein
MGTIREQSPGPDSAGGEILSCRGRIQLKSMVNPMRSKPLLSKSASLKTRKAVNDILPMRIADLDGCELASHCDRCGRHLQLYPGPTGLDPRTRLANLLEQLACGAQRKGRACGGQPRRLVLIRNERQWVLDASGDWVEDESVFWEHSDFEALAQRSGRHIPL